MKLQSHIILTEPRLVIPTLASSSGLQGWEVSPQPSLQGLGRHPCHRAADGHLTPGADRDVSQLYNMHLKARHQGGIKKLGIGNFPMIREEQGHYTFCIRGGRLKKSIL